MLEYLEEGVDDGTTTTSNLTEFLRREISMEKNGMERIILTSDTDHIGIDFFPVSVLPIVVVRIYFSSANVG